MFADGQPDNVHTVSPEEIRKWMESGDALVFDVREENEYVQAHIKGTTLLPLSRFDPAQVVSAVEANPGKKLVFHCRSGNRCGMAAQRMLETGYTGEINRMSGGIAGWYQMGFDITSGLPG